MQEHAEYMTFQTKGASSKTNRVLNKAFDFPYYSYSMGKQIFLCGLKGAVSRIAVSINIIFNILVLMTILCGTYHGFFPLAHIGKVYMILIGASIISGAIKLIIRDPFIDKNPFKDKYW